MNIFLFFFITHAFPLFSSFSLPPLPLSPSVCVKKVVIIVLELTQSFACFSAPFVFRSLLCFMVEWSFVDIFSIVQDSGFMITFYILCSSMLAISCICVRSLGRLCILYFVFVFYKKKSASNSLFVIILLSIMIYLFSLSSFEGSARYKLRLLSGFLHLKKKKFSSDTNITVHWFDYKKKEKENIIL